MISFCTLSLSAVAVGYFRAGIVGYLLALVIGQTVGNVFGIVKIYRASNGFFETGLDKETKHSIVVYSIPLVFNGLSWWINGSLDRYILNYYCNASELGIYAIASKIPNILSVVLTIFAQSWVLLSIKEYGKNDTDEFYTRAYKYYNAVLIIGAVVLIAINKTLSKLLFVNEFYEAWRSSSILIISVVFSGIAGFLSGIFGAIKDNKALAITTVGGAIVNTVLNFVLIPKYGGVGAGIATAVSFIFIWAFRLKYALKAMDLRPKLFTDVIAYLVLAVEVVVEHVSKIVIPIHIVCIVVIAGLYYRELFDIIMILLKMIKTYINKHRIIRK